MKGMARQTLAVVQQCLEADRFEVTFHFRGRMRERGLFWEDVLHALDNAGNVSNDGFDMVGHSKWIVQGPAANGGMIEIVCAVKPDETGVRFITIYWE